MFVLLQAPFDGYYLVVRATSDKHFSLEDSGWIEIRSGSHDDMQDLKQDYEIESSRELIELYCGETFSLIQTTDDCLRQILNNEPYFLDNKVFL